jgi:hypothetical protein
MRMRSRSFWLPRRGNTFAEYEDAFAVDEESGRFAVADGATESCFAGAWARLLVNDFACGADCDAASWPGAFALLQEQWTADVHQRIIPWYAEPGVAQGAFATFLGTTLSPSSDVAWQWQTVAVGDTCILHTRGSTLLRTFPITRSQDFGSAPKLVGSRMLSEDVGKRRMLWTDGAGLPGDFLWTMTDALAHWCLLEHEIGGNPCVELEWLLTLPNANEQFTSWIERLRDVGRLRNDDVTLLVVQL